MMRSGNMIPFTRFVLRIFVISLWLFSFADCVIIFPVERALFFKESKNNMTSLWLLLGNNVSQSPGVNGPLVTLNGLTWLRCTYGQVWNAATDDCTGTGNAGNEYGANGTLQFCSTANTENCNSFVPGGPLTAGGGGDTSTLYLACNGLNSPATYGINQWRVATKSELESIAYCSTGTTAPDVNGDYMCNSGSTAPAVIGNYFPNTVSGVYSSSTADPCCSNSRWVDDYSNGTITRSNGSKAIPTYARCVAP